MKYDNKKNQLEIWCDLDKLKKQIKWIHDCYIEKLEDNNGYYNDYSIESKKFMNKINWLYNIAENIITKYPEFDIFKYLPLTKAGNFIKGKSILIASTDMNDIRDDEYHTKNTLQLRLYPIKTDDTYYHIRYTGNKMELNIAQYNCKPKSKPIFTVNCMPSDTLVETCEMILRHPKKADILNHYNNCLPRWEKKYEP